MSGRTPECRRPPTARRGAGRLQASEEPGALTSGPPRAPGSCFPRAPAACSAGHVSVPVLTGVSAVDLFLLFLSKVQKMKVPRVSR